MSSPPFLLPKRKKKRKDIHKNYWRKGKAGSGMHTCSILISACFTVAHCSCCNKASNPAFVAMLSKNCRQFLLSFQKRYCGCLCVGSGSPNQKKESNQHRADLQLQGYTPHPHIYHIPGKSNFNSGKALCSAR